MSMNKCICTGFVLCEEETVIWYAADLYFLEKGKYAVVINPNGQIGDCHYDKRASFSIHGEHFQKDNVLVFYKGDLLMNEALLEYIAPYIQGV